MVEEAKGDRIDFMFKTLDDSLPAHGVELHPFHLRPFQALLYHLDPPLDPTMSTVSLGWAGMESYPPLSTAKNPFLSRSSTCPSASDFINAPSLSGKQILGTHAS